MWRLFGTMKVPIAWRKRGIISVEFRPLHTNREMMAGAVDYRVTGELVPILEFDLTGHEEIYFEHHVLLYREPSVGLKAAIPKGSLKRLIGKMPVIMARAAGRGRVALSRDGAGQVMGVAVLAGQELDVREHQFLAATGNMSYGFSRIRGISNLLFGGTGFFVDQFGARHSDGIVWIHAYGNLVEVQLDPGDVLDVEPGGWCYKDRSVKMDTVPINVTAGLFSSLSFTLNRFHGPGRLGIQSMTVYLPTEE